MTSRVIATGLLAAAALAAACIFCAVHQEGMPGCPETKRDPANGIRASSNASTPFGAASNMSEPQAECQRCHLVGSSPPQYLNVTLLDEDHNPTNMTVLRRVRTQTQKYECEGRSEYDPKVPLCPTAAPSPSAPPRRMLQADTADTRSRPCVKDALRAVALGSGVLSACVLAATLAYAVFAREPEEAAAVAKV